MVEQLVGVSSSLHQRRPQRPDVLASAVVAGLLMAALGCAPLSVWLPVPDVAPTEAWPARAIQRPATVAASVRNPSIIPSAALQHTPTATPTVSTPPSPTAAPKGPSAQIAVVTSETVEVRDGPGAGSALVGVLRRGDRVTILARNGEATRLKICCVGGQRGWIGAAQVAVSRPLRDVIAVAAAEQDFPARQTIAPTATPEASPVATATEVAASLPVRLTIPALDIDCPVVEVGWQEVEAGGQRQLEWKVAAYAAGHHQGSALPGQPGNMVMSGHHNIDGEVFRSITLAWPAHGYDELDAITDRSRVLDGQTVFVHNAAGEVFRYVIEGMYRLKDSGVSEEQRRRNARFMTPTADPMLTLITCWPYYSNTYRIVVVARLAD
jgi:sortase A